MRRREKGIGQGGRSQMTPCFLKEITIFLNEEIVDGGG